MVNEFEVKYGCAWASNSLIKFRVGILLCNNYLCGSNTGLTIFKNVLKILAIYLSIILTSFYFLYSAYYKTV